MVVLTPQKVPKKVVSVEDRLALFCYKFPQYTFAQARKLPFIRVLRLLKVAKREDARRMLEFTQIAAAPHSKKGEAVKKMIQYYKGIIND